MGETIAVIEKLSLIPYTRKYFDSIAKAPQKTEEFASMQQPINLEVDLSIVSIYGKQTRLDTIHEILGHLIFSNLKLLSMAGLVTRDLYNIDLPICTGCDYGKSHPCPWHHKNRNIPN